MNLGKAFKYYGNEVEKLKVSFSGKQNCLETRQKILKVKYMYKAYVEVILTSKIRSTNFG